MKKACDYYKEVKLIENRVDSLTKDQAFAADFWGDNTIPANPPKNAISSS